MMNNISRNDVIDLMTLSHGALFCNDIDGFKELVSQLNSLFNVENLVCGRVNIIEISQIKVAPSIDICNIKCSPEYLDRYIENQCYYTDQILFEFINQLKPVNWGDVDKKYQFSYPASLLAMEFNMKDGWTFGTIDSHSMDSFVFYVGVDFSTPFERTKKILEYIIPFFFGNV